MGKLGSPSHLILFPEARLSRPASQTAWDGLDWRLGGEVVGRRATKPAPTFLEAAERRMQFADARLGSASQDVRRRAGAGRPRLP